METNLTTLYEGWQTLPMFKINQPIFEQRRKPWTDLAISTIPELELGRVSLLGETSTGKTVSALLVSTAYKKTLLFTPSKILAKQHSELYTMMTGENSTVLTGEQTSRRDWQSSRLITATPQTFLSDMKSGIVKPEEFDLYIFDEYHFAVKNHAYVKTLNAIESNGKKLFLTATPGNKKEAKILYRLCKIRKELNLVVPTPHIKHRINLVKLDEKLLEIESLFKKIFTEFADKLTSLEYGSKKFFDPDSIGQDDMDKLRPQKNTMFWDKDNFDLATTYYYAYFELLHCYKLCLTESYVTFLSYVIYDLRESKWSSKKLIFNHPSFKKIIELAGKNMYDHPKILALKDVVMAPDFYNMKKLIFIWQKTFGLHLKDVLCDKYLRAEVLYGGHKNKSEQEFQKGVLKSIGNGELDILIATSVIEVGVNIPEVDLVVHYLMPTRNISRKQRTGRTGRVREGNVLFICLDHMLDKKFYYGTAERKVEDAVNDNSDQYSLNLEEEKPPIDYFAP